MAKTKKIHQVNVKTEACKGCHLCVEYCKEGVLQPSGKLNKIGYDAVEPVNGADCNGCMVCVLMCPDLVLEVYYE